MWFHPDGLAEPCDQGWKIRLTATGPRLHVAPDGDGPSPVVVFVSAAGGRAKDAAWLQEALAPLTSSLAYDRAGLGLSDPAPDAEPFAPVEELAALLDRVAPGRPAVLAGLGHGGLIAQMLAVTAPERVAGLVLVHTPPAGALTRPPLGVALGPALARARVIRAATAREARAWPDLARRIRDLGPPDRELPVALVAAARPDTPAHDAEVAPAQRSRRGWIATAHGASLSDLTGPRRGALTLQALRHIFSVLH